MHFDQNSFGHPARNQLVAYVESLVDHQATVSAAVAAHVAECPACKGEVNRIKASLRLVDLSGLPEPSKALTREIVLRAKAELGKRGRAPKNDTGVLAAQFLLCAAAACILAVYSFTTALNDASALSRTPTPGAPTLVADSVPDPVSLSERAAAIKALSASVSLLREVSDSPREQEYRRALELLDHDVNAALGALQRNPGSTRANQVMLMSLERQLQSLRGLYLDRTY
jgi:hypothetical protein